MDQGLKTHLFHLISQVLLATEPEQLSQFKAASVIKKAFGNSKVSTQHDCWVGGPDML